MQLLFTASPAELSPSCQSDTAVPSRIAAWRGHVFVCDIYSVVWSCDVGQFLSCMGHLARVKIVHVREEIALLDEHVARCNVSQVIEMCKG